MQIPEAFTKIGFSNGTDSNLLAVEETRTIDLNQFMIKEQFLDFIAGLSTIHCVFFNRSRYYSFKERLVNHQDFQSKIRELFFVYELGSGYFSVFTNPNGHGLL